jgi:hypothetical protein
LIVQNFDTSVSSVSVDAAENRFRSVFAKRSGNNSIKVLSYLDVYDRKLARFVGTSPRVLEIGVARGGFVDVLRDYLGPYEYHGIDINENCKRLESEGVYIHIGSQSNTKLLESLGEFDLIFDDGGHKGSDMVVSFGVLWPKLRRGGIYFVEDIHTSYWPQVPNGRTNFMRFAVHLVNEINSLALIDPRAGPLKRQSDLLLFSEYAKTIRSVHFFPSMVVFEKGENEFPLLVNSGEQDLTGARPEVEGTFLGRLARPIVAPLRKFLRDWRRRRDYQPPFQS